MRIRSFSVAFPGAGRRRTRRAGISPSRASKSATFAAGGALGGRAIGWLLWTGGSGTHCADGRKKGQGQPDVARRAGSLAVARAILDRAEADLAARARGQLAAVDVELPQRPLPVPGGRVHEVHHQQVLQLLDLGETVAL